MSFGSKIRDFVGGYDRKHTEFLPAALEILETPPSPNQTAFMMTICAVALAAIVWSYIGKIDIVAVAQGKVQPVGRVKIIQPADGGKVVKVFVQNGQRVNAGDPLVDIDPEDARSDLDAALATFHSLKGEIQRRQTAIKIAESGTPSNVAEINWQEDVPKPIRKREEDVLEADIASLQAALLLIDSQVSQKASEVEKLKSVIASQEQLLAILRERVKMREELYKQHAGTRTALIDAKESLRNQETTLSSQTGQFNEAQESLKVSKNEREKIKKAFISDNQQKLAEAQRQADELEQKAEKAKVRLSYKFVTSPASGIVYGSTITTIGQVVSSGEEIMRIVPDGSKLEIEAYLENKDIGFVKAGQPAVIKVESYPFTKYGTLDGKVTDGRRTPFLRPTFRPRKAPRTRLAVSTGPSARKGFKTSCSR